MPHSAQHPLRHPLRHLLVTAQLPSAELSFWVDLDQAGTLEQLAGTLHASLSLIHATEAVQSGPAAEELCYKAAQSAYAQFTQRWSAAQPDEKERLMRELAQNAQPHLTLRKAAELMLRVSKGHNLAKEHGDA